MNEKEIDRAVEQAMAEEANDAALAAERARQEEEERTKLRSIESPMVKELIERVGNMTKDEVLTYNIDLDLLRKDNVLAEKLAPWIEKKVDDYLGGPQRSLADFILRKVNGQAPPQALIGELSR